MPHSEGVWSGFSCWHLLVRLWDTPAIDQTTYAKSLASNVRDFLQRVAMAQSDVSWPQVDIDEFCDGCMRLGGPAKSFDMNCMWYEQRQTSLSQKESEIPKRGRSERGWTQKGAKDKHQRFPEWSWRSVRRNWWRTSGEVWKEIFELLLLEKIVRSIFHQNSTANFTVKLHYEVLGCGGPYKERKWSSAKSAKGWRKCKHAKEHDRAQKGEKQRVRAKRSDVKQPVLPLSHTSTTSSGRDACPIGPLTCEGQKVPQSSKPRKFQSNENKCDFGGRPKSSERATKSHYLPVFVTLVTF